MAGLTGAMGLKSAFSLAQLIGQDIVARSISLTQAAGLNAIQMVTGARLKLGTGTTDYLESNGATVINAGGAFSAATSVTMNSGFNGPSGPIIQAGIVTIGDSVMRGNVASNAASVAVSFANTTALAAAGAQVAAFFNDLYSTKVLAIDQAGKLVHPTAGNSTGTPGNATLNTPSGRSAFAAAAATCVITNSLVSATSQVYVAVQTADATLTFIKSVVPAAGSFTVTANAAATGTTNFCWFVVN